MQGELYAISRDISYYLLGFLVTAIFAYIFYLHREISSLSRDFHRLELRIASDHLTKSELRNMFREQEMRINAQLKHYFTNPKGNNHER